MMIGPGEKTGSEVDTLGYHHSFPYLMGNFLASSYYAKADVFEGHYLLS